ncbi:PTS sugar transporter subunit IIA [Thermophilibacter sp.]|uniref:PTS sugar transporter subunit IIA n=1 Tax=Thermophilibacter sp. TaxID=2847309 RepID=UPI003A93A3DA
MTRIVLASHGRLADGMKDTLSFILGDLPNVSTICAYVDQDVSLRSQIDQTFAEFSPEDAVVVVTDIFGGSVNNEFMALLGEKDFILVAGMNMPTLVELVSEDEPTVEGVQSVVERGRQSILVCNGLASDESEEF